MDRQARTGNIVLNIVKSREVGTNTVVGAGRRRDKDDRTQITLVVTEISSYHLNIRHLLKGWVTEELVLPPLTSVADPDPSDPYVFGPPGFGSGSISQRYGSGSGSFYHQAKNVRKILIPTVLWLLFDFLSLKNDANVPSKSNKQKMSWIRNTAPSRYPVRIFFFSVHSNCAANFLALLNLLKGKV